jgi:succinate dehydrogenase flavin-adding protein (antitoxin of CptAB toxin-antitoxin module)
MESESNNEDIIIKSYLELYLRSLNDSKPQKFIDIIKKRMLTLIKRKQNRINNP